MPGVYLRPGRRVMLAAMTPTPAAVALVLRVLFLFGYALLFALVEIEIEGPHGWAERLPTWFRVTHAGGAALRPLHAGQAAHRLPRCDVRAAALELPHRVLRGASPGAGRPRRRRWPRTWSGSSIWDLLWFLLNPRFGWARFRKGEVWWHGRTWIGRFPIDYWGALARFDARSRPAHTSAAATSACSRATPCCWPGSPPSRWLRPRRAPLHALVRAHAPPRQPTSAPSACRRTSSSPSRSRIAGRSFRPES